MSYRLFVRPMPPYADPDQSPPDAQLFSWVLQDASGDAQARGTADTREHIEQTLAQNALEKVLLIGLIPGDEAVFCLADIPAKQTRFIQQALPYAVEEQIAQDIDSVHLALGGPHTPEATGLLPSIASRWLAGANCFLAGTTPVWRPSIQTLHCCRRRNPDGSSAWMQSRHFCRASGGESGCACRQIIFRCLQ